MSVDNELRIHEIGRHIHVLGPGTRFVVWVQGCLQRCPGCIAPDARPLDGGRIETVDSLAETILSVPDLEGLTLSGGEPFLQAEALARLVRTVRATRDLGVIVCAGCLPHAEELLAVTDLLIDGPYIDELNDNATLRGSSNQRIIQLTDRYREALTMYGKPGARDTELLYTENGLFVAGIPSRSRLRMIRQTSDTGSDEP